MFIVQCNETQISTHHRDTWEKTITHLAFSYSLHQKRTHIHTVKQVLFTNT